MPHRPGYEFMQDTRYARLEPSAQAQGLPQPPLALPADPALPQISLPTADALWMPNVDLAEVMLGRTSVREYASTSLTLEELAWLLWSTQGVKKTLGTRASFRTVPSAGARHAFETYLLLHRVHGIAPGLYRYLALEHALQPVPRDGDSTEAITTACLGQGMLASCAVAFIWVAVAERMTWRYGQRGYRYLHLDAGHVCQNLYLAAEAIDAGACAIAAFDDDALHAALGIDGDALFAIYLATVGKKEHA
jgi:SagB-type dehydrogenase family enzyme